jgi:hypothetical protein
MVGMERRQLSWQRGTFECSFQSVDDFGGVRAAYIDIYPVGSDFANDHKKFGGIYVRIWLFGNPPSITSGIFLGAERAEQSEPRRGVSLTRRLLGQRLVDFEHAEGFSYHTWTSANFPWATKSSRAVARQLEQFISFRQDAADVAQKSTIEEKVRKAVTFLDRSLHLLKPISEFGKDIIQEYYSENLPDPVRITPGALDQILIVDSLDEALRADEVRIRTTRELLLRYASALLSKRFLIATGLAGSGKTKLAQAFARWLSASHDCHMIVPVGADWSGNENVLGYPNGLDKETYISKPALEIMIRAKSDPDTPYFLILDEMNLSHVERYFADILSVIESEEKIQLYDGDERKANGNVIPACLDVPKNLFIIGTVNVDETTYMFSPKVLDRANVIEFRMEAAELGSFLSNPTKPNLSQLDGKGVSFGRAFVEASKSQADVPADIKSAYEAEMLLLFKALQAHGAEFGFRTANEAARFIHFYNLLGRHPTGDTSWFNKAMDCVIYQKLLPKLHGSRMKLGPLLKVLWFLCVKDLESRGQNALDAAEAASRSMDKTAEPSADVPTDAPYPLSAEKIGRMWRLLRDNGFASFAEA